jgi:hypothetical protein
VASRGGQLVACTGSVDGRSILSWLGGVKCVGWRWVGVGWAKQRSESEREREMKGASFFSRVYHRAAPRRGVARLARKGAGVLEARGIELACWSWPGRMARPVLWSLGKGKRAAASSDVRDLRDKRTGGIHGRGISILNNKGISFL